MSEAVQQTAPAVQTVICRLALDMPNGMVRAILEYADGRISVATIKPEQKETIVEEDLEVTFQPDDALNVARMILADPRRADVHISPKMKALAALCLVLAEKRIGEREASSCG